MTETLPPIENSRPIEPALPSIDFVERAAELRRLLENPLSGNWLTAEKICARRRALRLQLRTEFIRKFGLSPDDGDRARRDYYRRFRFNPPRVFDHKDFFRFSDWRIVISQPYFHVEDDVKEELASLAYRHCGEAFVLPDWSYWYPGHTTLIFFKFPSLSLKRGS